MPDCLNQSFKRRGFCPNRTYARVRSTSNKGASSIALDSAGSSAIFFCALSTGGDGWSRAVVGVLGRSWVALHDPLVTGLSVCDLLGLGGAVASLARDLWTRCNCTY